jgi:hypothetical protein
MLQLCGQFGELTLLLIGNRVVQIHEVCAASRNETS